MTERADAIEMSCSLERPPARTATRTRAASRPVGGRLGRLSPVKRPTNRVTMESGLACEPPTGSCDITMPSGVVGVLEHDARAEPGVLERGLGDGDVLGGHVGNRERRRATWRPRASPSSLASSRSLRSAPGRSRSRPRASSRRPREPPRILRWSWRSASSNGMLDDARHDHGLGALRHVDTDASALDDDRAGREALRHDDPRVALGVHLGHLCVEPRAA